MAVLIPCLVALRSEFNTLAPGRDKGADGWIGDSAHRNRSSDHNPDETGTTPHEDADNVDEVHALDIDSSGPWPRSFNDIIMDIIHEERNKWLSSNDKCRLNNVIWNRKIYMRSNNFDPVPYTLSDPHTNHAHFSGRYETSCERDTRPWGVLEEDMPTADEIADAVIARLTNVLKTAETGDQGDDHSIVRNLRRIPWSYPGALDMITQVREIHEQTVDVPPDNG